MAMKISPFVCASIIAIGGALLPAQASTWSLLPDMSDARSFHTLSVLGDGTVLAAGGQNANGNLSSAQLYDFGKNQWLPLPPMSTARSAHTATVLADGDVLIAGGGTLQVERFSAKTRQWSAAASMGSSRSEHTATLLADGRVLVAGSCLSAAAEVYDPVADTWTSAGNMSSPRCSHTASRLPNGKVLIVGGLVSFPPNLPTRSAEIYDPEANAWSQVPLMGQARYGHSAVQLGDGRVVIAGGVDEKSQILATVEAYDWQANEWRQLTPMLVGRFAFPLVRLGDGDVLALGGFTSEGRTRTSERFDPVSEDWNFSGELNGISGDRIAATLLPDGRVFAAGGSNAMGDVGAGTERFEETRVFGDGFESSLPNLD
jgi:hypothetical protein